MHLGRTETHLAGLGSKTFKRYNHPRSNHTHRKLAMKPVTNFDWKAIKKGTARSLVADSSTNQWLKKWEFRFAISFKPLKR